MKRAQELGYAEADPSFDVDGIDAAHKLALLAAMAFGARAHAARRSRPRASAGSTPIDFEAAREFGYRIKLLAIAKRARDARPASASRCACTRR